MAGETEVTSDDDSDAPRPRRRQVLRAATVTVLGAGVVTGTGAGILRALNSDDGSGDGRLLLQTDAVSGVGILEKQLKDPVAELAGVEHAGRKEHLRHVHGRIGQHHDAPRDQDRQERA